MLFRLGRKVATPGALEALLEAQMSPLDLLQRHARGDWGEMTEDDLRANRLALHNGERLFSAYNLPTGVRLWVITEWDRSSTCLLLPSEY